MRNMLPSVIRWTLAVVIAGAMAPGWVGAEEPEGPAYTGCNAETAPVANAAFEQQVVELVNQERLSNGSLPPLKRVDELDRAARYYAEDMRTDNYFGPSFGPHDTYDRVGGSVTWVCAWNARIGKFYAGASSLAENIAWGYGSPASVMSGWMNSSGHRNNILGGSWEIGVGYANGNYWVQDFGRKSGRYPLVINREAAVTTTRSVSIYIYKGSGAAAWTHMRLKNDMDADFGPWQAFQNAFNWTLGPGNGARSVTVELSGNGGGTVGATSTDTITLNAPNMLGDLSDQMIFLHDLSAGQTTPAQGVLSLDKVGSGGALTWTADAEGGWFSLSSGGGATPAALTVTPTTFGGVPQTFTGAVTVTVTSPGGTENSPQRVDLTLIVVPRVGRVFLPLVRR